MYIIKIDCSINSTAKLELLERNYFSNSRVGMFSSEEPARNAISKPEEKPSTNIQG